jgi:hypothetical protein
MSTEWNEKPSNLLKSNLGSFGFDVTPVAIMSLSQVRVSTGASIEPLGQTSSFQQEPFLSIDTTFVLSRHR